MHELAIVIVTEQGRLEAESKLLIDSIRTFAGQLSQVPIYSYQPRKSLPVAQRTKLFFENHHVSFIDLPLNTKHADYALANKVYVSAHAEAQINAKVIVFMDSDSVVFQEPKSFYLSEEIDVGLVPVFRKIGLAVNEHDDNYDYWLRISAMINSSFHNYVFTVVDNQKVLSYYNSGLQVVRRGSSLFQKARENFDSLLCLDKDFFMHRFLEQVNFSATALSLGSNICELGKGYNYPIKHHGKIKNPKYQIDSLDEVVTGHYTTLFKKAKFTNPLSKAMFDTGKGEWFKRKALEYGVYSPWYRRWLQVN